MRSMSSLVAMTDDNRRLLIRLTELNVASFDYFNFFNSICDASKGNGMLQAGSWTLTVLKLYLLAIYRSGLLMKSSLSLTVAWPNLGCNLASGQSQVHGSKH